MAGNALARLLDNAVEYDTWRVPLDPRLRRATVISGVLLITLFLNLVLVPALLNWTYSGYFYFGAQFLREFLQAMYAAQPWLLGFVAISLMVYGLLLYKTDQLEAGASQWHNVATAEVILGSVSGFVIGVEALIIFVNLLIWVVVAVIGIIMLFSFLAGMGSSR